jgi:hypothetical protein
MKRWTISIWIAFFLSGIGIILIVVFALNRSFNDGSGLINPSLASDYGDFIGGLVGPILSLAGFLLIYETISAQRKTFEIQQFESKFFDLLRFHRDNVQQMTHRIPWDANEKYYNGTRVFIEIKSQFLKLYRIVKKKVDICKSIKSSEKELTAINISYLILYFGVSKDALSDLKSALTDYDPELIKQLIEDIVKRKTKYSTKVVYFGGHQVRLGHYFRHLFLSVKYVNDTKFLTRKQKYKYVKIIRTQLSQYELAIFFINSLSIGRKWEKKGLITTFKLIKNLPPNFIPEINPKTYYNNFKYEWDK